MTAGTTVISDWFLFRVTVDPGHTFLDRMIQLVEAAKWQKTPNEIALTVLLSVLTLIFLIVVATIAPIAAYLEARINVADLVVLLVALIPTTIGALCPLSESRASTGRCASTSWPRPGRRSKRQATSRP